MINNKKIKKVIAMKNNSPIVCLTSYTKQMAKIVDRYCDITLVGDSVGTALYGMKNTKTVNIQTMLLHTRSVVRGSKKSLIVADMPFKTYLNEKLAYKNAKLLMSTGCDAVKLEGGVKIAEIIKFLVKKGIPVMGHIGLLPQHVNSNFRVYGRADNEKRDILFDALALEQAGVFSMVLECIDKKLASEITSIVSIPTIGIGSSVNCDGQILVIDDILGMSNFKARFVKKYSNISISIEKGVKKYSQEVRKKIFPSSKYTY